jgi:hypothetical protein
VFVDVPVGLVGGGMDGSRGEKLHDKYTFPGSPLVGISPDEAVTVTTNVSARTAYDHKLETSTRMLAATKALKPAMPVPLIWSIATDAREGVNGGVYRQI